MRKRLVNDGLPKRVYFRNGAYFYVVKGGKWVHLGKDRDMAVKLSFSMAPPQKDEVPALREYLKKKSQSLQSRNKHRPKRQALAFSTTVEDVLALAEQRKWTCAVSGLAFSLRKINGRMPFAPSVDRIDAMRGYELGNIRIVAVIANLAMNVWGEEPLRMMVEAAKNMPSIEQNARSGEQNHEDRPLARVSGHDEGFRHFPISE